MPHRIIQNAANRIALITAGATASPWKFDGAHDVVSADGTQIRSKPTIVQETDESQSRLNAEYIYTMQPDVGIELSRLLDSQASLHTEQPYKCYYCNPEFNPLKLPCPTLRLSEAILELDEH